jgi:Rap guanine nucleotide exchange factor 2
LCEVSVENSVIKQKRLPDHVDNLPERLPINARYYLKNNNSTETLVPDHLSNELIREARIHFLHLDSLEICAQLTLRDFAIFKSIQPTEYIDYIFKIKSNYGIPHLEKFLRLPNQEMYWTITEIIREPNVTQRSKILKQFIKIASKNLISKGETLSFVNI